MAVSANRLELLQIADAVAREKVIDKQIVLDAYSSFSDELGRLVTRFFDENWIDGPVRPGKRGFRH